MKISERKNYFHKKNIRRRHFLLSAILCLFVGTICGCTGNSYSQKERDTLEQKGRAILEEYLEKNVPGAEVLSATAQEEYVLGSKWYLTEYVKGEYTDVGKKWEYFVNTETGRIYSGKPFERVKALISEEIKNLLGLPEESELSEIIVSPMELPHGEGHYGKDTNWYDEIWCHEVLPIDMTGREEEYLAMADRAPIPVELADFRVPEEVCLAGHHLEEVPQGILGLSFGQIKVSDAYEELVFHPGEFMSYLRWEEKEECGFFLRGIACADREDMEGAGEEKKRVLHAEFNLADMAVLSQTENGYSLHVSENRQELAFEVLLLAEEGSFVTENMYEAKGVSEENPTVLGWGKREDGRLQLFVWNTISERAEFPFSAREDRIFVKK